RITEHRYPLTRFGEQRSGYRIGWVRIPIRWKQVVDHLGKHISNKRILLSVVILIRRCHEPREDVVASFVMLTVAAEWEHEAPSSIGFADETERCETVGMGTNRACRDA